MTIENVRRRGSPRLCKIVCLNEKVLVVKQNIRSLNSQFRVFVQLLSSNVPAPNDRTVRNALAIHSAVIFDASRNPMPMNCLRVTSAFRKGAASCGQYMPSTTYLPRSFPTEYSKASLRRKNRLSSTSANFCMPCPKVWTRLRTKRLMLAVHLYQMEDRRSEWRIFSENYEDDVLIMQRHDVLGNCAFHHLFWSNGARYRGEHVSDSFTSLYRIVILRS